MKKVLILTLSLALLFSGSSTLLAFGGSSCEVPKFLKEGSSVLIVVSSDESIVKILEIDKKSCWIKVLRRHDDPSWINLKTVSIIQPQKN